MTRNEESGRHSRRIAASVEKSLGGRQIRSLTEVERAEAHRVSHARSVDKDDDVLVVGNHSGKYYFCFRSSEAAGRNVMSMLQDFLDTQKGDADSRGHHERADECAAEVGQATEGENDRVRPKVLWSGEKRRISTFSLKLALTLSRSLPRTLCSERLRGD